MDHGSNPCGFACGIRFFIIASGMSERSFCIFRRIHVRLTWASQVAYECFFEEGLTGNRLLRPARRSDFGSAAERFRRIAIRNASDDIQVFNEMFVSCNVRSCVTIEISGPGVCNFKF